MTGSPSSRLVALALFTLVVATTSAQQANTARLAGTVVTGDDTPQPVRRAIVRIGGQGAEGRSAITDDQGRFSFAGLPAGRFTLTASKPAYLTTTYGAKSPGRPGTAVTVAIGQAIVNLRLLLPRGASISGTVRDRSGQTLPAVAIKVVRVDAVRPSPEAAPKDVLTDDRGAFRIFGLMPGTYAVAAVPRLIGPTGAITVMSTSEMDALFRAQQLRASGSPVSAATAAPRVTSAAAYAPVFYPGTATAVDATPITVRAGESRDGVDFTVDLVPVATVEGNVVSPGVLPELQISLGADGPQIEGLLPTTGVTLADRPGVNGKDTFRLNNVAPGHYTLLAQSSNTRTVTNGSSTSVSQVEPGTVRALWGTAEIDIRGEPISGVTIQLQPLMALTGRVAFDATSLVPPQNLTSMRVTLSLDVASAGRLGAAMRSGGPFYFGFGSEPVALNAAVRADGTFQVSGLLPGKYTLSAVVPGASGASGWRLRSATAGTSDLLDTDVEVTAGSNIADVVLTFSDRHSELSGTLQAADGQPAPEYVVAVFPADPSAWLAGARRLKATRPGSDGHFSFVDLPAGEYVLAALTDTADDDWQTPATLQELAKSPVRVTLGEGEKKTQNLQIGGKL